MRAGPEIVLAALGSAARTADEIAAGCGCPADSVAEALDLLVRARRVAWRDMDPGDGVTVRVWWAVPAGLSEAWWRALGDDAGVLAA
jgi:hypothetical protein